MIMESCIGNEDKAESEKTETVQLGKPRENGRRRKKTSKANLQSLPLSPVLEQDERDSCIDRVVNAVQEQLEVPMATSTEELDDTILKEHESDGLRNSSPSSVSTSGDCAKKSMDVESGRRCASTS